jgi:hypothetical protein
MMFLAVEQVNHQYHQLFAFMKVFLKEFDMFHKHIQFIRIIQVDYMIISEILDDVYLTSIERKVSVLFLVLRMIMIIELLVLMRCVQIKMSILIVFLLNRILLLKLVVYISTMKLLKLMALMYETSNMKKFVFMNNQ